jgi:hypothetical protein
MQHPSTLALGPIGHCPSRVFVLRDLIFFFVPANNEDRESTNRNSWESSKTAGPVGFLEQKLPKTSNGSEIGNKGLAISASRAAWPQA